MSTSKPAPPTERELDDMLCRATQCAKHFDNRAPGEPSVYQVKSDVFALVREIRRLRSIPSVSIPSVAPELGSTGDAGEEAPGGMDFSAKDLIDLADTLRQCATLLLVEKREAGDSPLICRIVRRADLCAWAARQLAPYFRVRISRPACCQQMRDALNELDRLRDKDIRAQLVPTFAGHDLRYCPFCGKEIVRFRGIPRWFT